MKILFLTRGWPVGGGTEVWLDTLFGALEARGVNVTVAVAKGAVHNEPISLFRANRYIKDGIILDGGSGSRAGCQYQVEKLLHRLTPDIVVPVRLHDALLVSAREKAGKGFRLLYPLHEYRAGFFQDIINFTLFIDRVVVCEELSRRAVASLTMFPADKIDIVPQGIVMKTIQPRDFSCAPLRIGFAGRLETPQKKVLDLVGICRKLTDAGINFRMYIAGTGPDEQLLKHDLADLIEKGLVVMEGWLPPDKLAESFYPTIDLLLVTSTWETGPIVAWEAMASGAVLVTSRYRGLESSGFLVHEQNCLVFDVGDLDGAVRHVSRLANSSAMMKQLSERGVSDVKITRSIDIIAERWESIFANVLNQPIVSEYAVNRGNRLPQGRLEKLGLPIGLVELLRRFVGREYHHASPGEEWPFYSAPVDIAQERLDETLRQLDSSSIK